MSAASPLVSDLQRRSAADPDRLYLQLLGEVQLYWAGERLSPPGPKPLAVLAYVHLNGGANREELAEVFWPTKDSAHQNVRQALTTLRRLGGSGVWLLEDGPGLALAAVSDVSELRERAGTDPAGALDFALGSGTILGRQAMPSPVFENWLDEERRRFRSEQLGVLHACGLQLLDDGQFDRARDLLHQALYMEPQADNEATYRALMLLEHRAGRTTQALEVFEDCRRMLDSELGALPDPQTLALLELIEDRRAGTNRRGHLLGPQDLARQDDPLFGRHSELEQLVTLLRGQGRVLLQGLGGLGKTHLAREVALKFTREGRPVAWLEVGGDPAQVTLTGLLDLLRPAPGVNLAGALEERSVGLLVLDNAVNSFAAPQVLAQLPEWLPVLVTSRLRLPGLPRLELSRLPRAAALELLAHHLPAGTEGHSELSNPDALCALLGDHPFAVRLAALTLVRSPDAGVVRALYDAPQDTIRALLEQSVAQLEPRAYEAYLGLGSLYAPQGTPELLTWLLGRPLDEVTDALFALVDRGLLTRESRPGSDTLSFQMHDLTWQAAREHRAHLPHHLLRAVTGYAEAYASQPDQLATDLTHLLGAADGAPPELLRRLMRAWLGGQYIAARGFPTAHLHLLQRAIDHAEQEGDSDTASLLNGKYADVCQALLGDHSTATERLLRAAAQSRRAGNPGRQAVQLALAGQLEAAHGLPEAMTHLEEAQRLADQGLDPFVQARVRAQRAVAHAMGKEFVEARALLLEARALLRHLVEARPDDQAGWAAYLGVLSNLGQVEMRLGDLAGALELKREVWRVASGRDDRLYMARSALDEGELLHLLGQSQAAMGRLREAVTLSQGLGAGSLESMARHLLQDISSAEPALDHH